MPPPQVVAYFAAEKQGGILLGCLGLASLGLALFLWVNRGPFVAMAWPLAVVGVLQLAVGIPVAARARSQVAALEKGLQAAAEATVAAEVHRMNRVNTSFRIVKAAELAFILVGLFLVFFFRQRAAWSAVGLGLLVEAAVLLAFDVFAHERALVYTSWLQSLAPGAGGA